MSTGNNVRLHRVFKAPPDRVYRAFTDPSALVKWMAPYGFTATVHHMDVRTGGTYRMSFANFSTGSSHSFGGTYLEIVPNERMRYTDKFEDPNMPGEIQMNITFRKVLCGTEVKIEQDNLPAQIPAEFCHLGWQESLNLLALLVDPEIPDAP